MKQQIVKISGLEAEQTITSNEANKANQIIRVTSNGITEQITMPESGQLIIITQQFPIKSNREEILTPKIDYQYNPPPQKEQIEVEPIGTPKTLFYDINLPNGHF